MIWVILYLAIGLVSACVYGYLQEEPADLPAYVSGLFVLLFWPFAIVMCLAILCVDAGASLRSRKKPWW